VRLELDTNTAVSGILWHGVPGKLIDAVQAKRVELYTSAPLLAELQGILTRGKFANQLKLRSLSGEGVLESYAAIASIVMPDVIIPKVTRDPADDLVLATAIAARADLIVSGDAHLLNLKAFHRIPILTAAEALNRIAQSSRR
jgi:putative PIN family toxin of toxin-antitoxin system